MKIALKEALKAYNEEEVPIGCTIVSQGKIIAKAHNKKQQKNNALMHAEIIAIQKAMKKLNSKYLNECEIYITLEPCLMCAGAIINARIAKIYFSTREPKGGALLSCLNIKDIKNINHYPQIYEGLCREEAINLLKSFFKKRR